MDPVDRLFDGDLSYHGGAVDISTNPMLIDVRFNPTQLREFMYCPFVAASQDSESYEPQYVQLGDGNTWCRGGADDGTHLGGHKAAYSAAFPDFDACRTFCSEDPDCKYFGYRNDRWCEFWQSSGECENNLNVANNHVLYAKQAPEEPLSDFVYGDKWGLAFVYDSDNHNDANNPLLTTCGSWGYAGATQMDTSHTSNRISSRNAVFTQPRLGTVTQNVEWYFCHAKAVTNINVFPLHSGHDMLGSRSTLQYMRDGQWITVLDASTGMPNPPSVGTATGRGLSFTTDGTICAQRW